MTEHTPGDWTFDEEWEVLKGEDGKPIPLVGISVPMTGGPRREEARANARLIAGLKRQRDDLLDALKSARPTLLRSLEVAEDPWLKQTRHEILNQADDAIDACKEIDGGKDGRR